MRSPSSEHPGTRPSICFYSPYSGRGNISGTRVRLEMLAQRFHARGVDVYIVGPFDKIEGATIHPMSLDVPLYQRPFAGLKALRLIAAIRPNAVVLEGPGLIFKLRGTKFVQMIHDSKFATRHRRRGGRLLWLYYFLTCRLCDFTMTVSMAERDRIITSLRLRSSRMIVSYNGVDEAWLTQPKVAGAKQFDVLYVSNFAPHKGHLRLLACLRKSGLRCAFVGGDLGTMSEVRSYANSEGIDVTFFQGLSTEALIGLYDSARVFVFPSELEGFGIPFVEARARGLPVVASDIAVFGELAAKLGGTIVDFDQSDSALTSIVQSLDCAESTPDLSDFLWSNIADRLLHDLSLEGGAVGRSPAD